ncbi:hypothetical protein [Spiroplasma endosymbiont of Villa modesta]|uniref:hypothetical protein n=1 Tax=Spiroplasma endosymbiont of Villa modesta TaxID=3066293 RepID=UPI00313AE30C
MRNIKTLLKLLGAVSLSTVAASSVVACGGGANPNPTPTKEMDVQVKKDFGFLDTNANSLVKLSIDINATSKLASWKSEQLAITATALLKGNTGEQKAKSNDAANFLVNVLKIEAKTGEGENRIFEVKKTNEISINVQSYSPAISKKAGNADYVVTGGTLIFNFQKNDKSLGDNFSLDILGQSDQGLVTSILPTTISNANFESIPGFVAGEPKSKFPVDTDLTQYFKTTELEGKTVKSIADLIKQGALKIKVSEAAEGTGNFVKGNTIKVKISIGDIQFATEETLFIS